MRFSAIRSILASEDQDLALVPMPKTESSTVLHYACTRQNIQVRFVLRYTQIAVL